MSFRSDRGSTWHAIVARAGVSAHRGNYVGTYIRPAVVWLPGRAYRRSAGQARVALRQRVATTIAAPAARSAAAPPATIEAMPAGPPALTWFHGCWNARRRPRPRRVRRSASPQDGLPQGRHVRVVRYRGLLAMEEPNTSREASAAPRPATTSSPRAARPRWRSAVAPHGDGRASASGSAGATKAQCRAADQSRAVETTEVKNGLWESVSLRRALAPRSVRSAVRGRRASRGPPVLPGRATWSCGRSPTDGSRPCGC